MTDRPRLTAAQCRETAKKLRRGALTNTAMSQDVKQMGMDIARSLEGMARMAEAREAKLSPKATK